MFTTPFNDDIGRVCAMGRVHFLLLHIEPSFSLLKSNRDGILHNIKGHRIFGKAIEDISLPIPPLDGGENL